MLQLSHKRNTSFNAPFRTFRSKTHSDISYQKSMNRLLSYLSLSRQNILRHSTKKNTEGVENSAPFCFICSSDVPLRRAEGKDEQNDINPISPPIFTPFLRPLLEIPKNAITISMTFFCLLSICFLPLPPLNPNIYKYINIICSAKR